MTSARWLASVALLAAASGAPASADQIFLKDAGVLSGRVVDRTATTVEIEMAAGRLTLPVERIDRIEEGPSVLDEYDRRVARVGARDRRGWLELARWASSEGLAARARQAYEHVVSIAPNDPEANRALGKVELDGRWVTPEESYRARGFVQFEGEWVTAEERQRILRDRRERELLERVLVASDERVREAEARAREADARAAEAEAAMRVGQVEGIPLWWVWGPGPMVWPSGPVVGTSLPARGRACW